MSVPARRGVSVAPLADGDRVGRNFWWTHRDLNLGPLACEASALTGLSYASTGNRIIAPGDARCKSLRNGLSI
jgi:hypothetical protein